MISNDIDRIWQRILESKYAETYCFLCGIELTNSNRSREHVLPKWLQTKYNLTHLILVSQQSRQPIKQKQSKQPGLHKGIK